MGDPRKLLLERKWEMPEWRDVSGHDDLVKLTATTINEPF